MKRLLLNVLIIFLSLKSFGQDHGRRGKTIVRTEFEKEQIIQGTWYLGQWTEYHKLTFDGYDLVGDNNIDTLYKFPYRLEPDTLVLYDGWGSIKFKNKIIKLTKDTLTLDGIGPKMGLRTYTRTKR